MFTYFAHAGHDHNESDELSTTTTHVLQTTQQQDFTPIALCIFGAVIVASVIGAIVFVRHTQKPISSKK